MDSRGSSVAGSGAAVSDVEGSCVALFNSSLDSTSNGTVSGGGVGVSVISSSDADSEPRPNGNSTDALVLFDSELSEPGARLKGIDTELSSDCEIESIVLTPPSCSWLSSSSSIPINIFNISSTSSSS